MLKTESHNAHTYYKQGCLEQLEQILLHCNNSSELLHLSFFSEDNQVNLRQTFQCLKAPAFPGACQECTYFLCCMTEILVDNYSVQPLKPSKTSGCCPWPPPSSLAWIKFMTGEVNPLVSSHFVLQPWQVQPPTPALSLLSFLMHKTRIESDTQHPTVSRTALTEEPITTAIRCWSLAQSPAQ